MKKTYLQPMMRVVGLGLDCSLLTGSYGGTLDPVTDDPLEG